jgi:hypothetical protein
MASSIFAANATIANTLFTRTIVCDLIVPAEVDSPVIRDLQNGLAAAETKNTSQDTTLASCVKVTSGVPTYTLPTTTGTYGAGASMVYNGSGAFVMYPAWTANVIGLTKSDIQNVPRSLDTLDQLSYVYEPIAYNVETFKYGDSFELSNGRIKVLRNCIVGFTAEVAFSRSSTTSSLTFRCVYIAKVASGLLGANNDGKARRYGRSSVTAYDSQAAEISTNAVVNCVAGEEFAVYAAHTALTNLSCGNIKSGDETDSRALNEFSAVLLQLV